MPKKVTFDVTANTKQAQKGLSDVEKTTNKLHAALDRFGPIGSGVASVLGKLGFSSVESAAALGVATGAIAGAVAIGEKALSMYLALTDQIRKYANITGESVEDSSRQIQAFKELGVDADVAAAGMFKLAKAAETNAKALLAVGIEVARNKDGTIDLNQTLYNAIKAYQGTGDASKRAAIIFTAFGKAGAAMIPILETNLAQLQRLQAQVGKVYTQKDLDAAKQYSIEQKKLGQSWEDMVNTLAQAVVPGLADLLTNTNAHAYALKRLNDEYAQGKIGQDEFNRAMMGGSSAHLRALEDEYRTSVTAAAQLDTITAARLREADALKAEADAEDVLYDAIHKSTDAHFAYRQSLLDLTKAQKDAKDAKGKDAEANLRLEEATYAVADAAVAQAVAQAALSGQTLTSAQQAEIQVNALRHLEARLDPKSQLRKDIDAYIRQLQSIPSDVSTTVGATLAGYSAKPRRLAAGGTVAPGETAIVGESGMETVTGGANGATVTPMGKGGEVHIHMHGMVIDGPAMDKFFREGLRRARFASGL
jgi:hypothetical protein